MHRPLSIAVLGFWHVHAGGYASDAQDHPDTTLTAVWDPDQARGSDAARDLGVPFAPDLDELLARDDLDAVVVTTATNEHVDVIGRAIAAGKHVFSEKLLAPTVDESEDLVRRARERGVALVVSLPRLTEAVTLAALREVREGRLGRITYARFRMAHDGWLADWLPERFADPGAAIGGAFTDLGCHPAYLCQLFLGPDPERVTATYTHVTGRAVEDNSVVTASWPDGAIGVAEAGFVTTPGATAWEIRGTEGALLWGLGTDDLMAMGPHHDPDRWTPVPLGDDATTPFATWVEHVRAGTRDDENTRRAIDLTRFVVRANEAAASDLVARR
ncbi:Gfo/Idh/MocA family protein [Curtobacterium sp. Leaf261]|uniref:Gfo/Idh/MocA family protein n=1 Tax=Curtobacterium sp. Leaf261 TaxID=1736311 RepID=UPI0007020868|nr:Gfo/Idh/MocA family oxidoreductase [Curtobacterium sp. Leaf261]KQO63834.1 oxidoreductase [Curtobacterium sp. Leaf261]